MNLNETVGVAGAFDTLRRLEGSSETAHYRAAIIAAMIECGVNDPESAFQEFVASNLLNRHGDGFALSTLGIRTCILLEAINGADLRDIYRRLARLDTSLRSYELIREGMTKAFLRNIHERSGFGRLYFCSPWINLDAKQNELLTRAVLHAERVRGSRPEILVITRPDEKTDHVPPPTVRPFQNLGATVFLNKRLHTKLYIREPDTSGGYSMAIMGSQNLTRSNYLELGIRVNSDCQIVDQLIAYFLEITNYCHEVRKESVK